MPCRTLRTATLSISVVCTGVAAAVVTTASTYAGELVTPPGFWLAALGAVAAGEACVAAVVAGRATRHNDSLADRVVKHEDAVTRRIVKHNEEVAERIAERIVRDVIEQLGRVLASRMDNLELSMQDYGDRRETSGHQLAARMAGSMNNGRRNGLTPID